MNRLGRAFLRVHKILYVCLSFNRSLFRAACMKVAPSIEHADALMAIGNVDFIVDVGANRGQFSLFASQIFPHAKFLCFEPLEEPFEICSKVLVEDKFNLVRSALGRFDESATMNVSASDDSSSLLDILPTQTQLYSGTERIQSQLVAVRALTPFLAQREIDFTGCGLLKIDVQGFELEVLRGAEGSLDRFDWVYCECSFLELYGGQPLVADVLDWLQGRGFRLSGAYNIDTQAGGQCIQGDFLFHRVSR